MGGSPNQLAEGIERVSKEPEREESADSSTDVFQRKELRTDEIDELSQLCDSSTDSHTKENAVPPL